MKKVILWETSDGKQHEAETLARNHDRERIRIILHDWLQGPTCMTCTARDLDLIIEEMMGFPSVTREMINRLHDVL